MLLEVGKKNTATLALHQGAIKYLQDTISARSTIRGGRYSRKKKHTREKKKHTRKKKLSKKKKHTRKKKKHPREKLNGDR